MILLLKYWRPLAGLIAVAGLAWFAYAWAYDRGAAAVQSRWDDSQAKAIIAAREADDRYRAVSVRLAEADAKVQLLLAYRPDPKVLIREIPTPVGGCPAVSDDFRVQYNAIAAGSPPAARPLP